MRSTTRPCFWKLYSALPRHVQSQARIAYQTFAKDPNHPGLRFKKLQGPGDFWSVRISRDYRAVGQRDGDRVVWLWIGSHADFDQLF